MGKSDAYRLFSNFEFTSCNWYEMFTFCDVLHRQKNANKLSRVRSTDWKSSYNSRKRMEKRTLVCSMLTYLTLKHGIRNPHIMNDDRNNSVQKCLINRYI